MNCSSVTFLHNDIAKLLQIHAFALPASQMLSLDDQYVALQKSHLIRHKHGKSGWINTPSPVSLRYMELRMEKGSACWVAHASINHDYVDQNI